MQGCSAATARIEHLISGNIVSALGYPHAPLIVSHLISDRHLIGQCASRTGAVEYPTPALTILNERVVLRLNPPSHRQRGIVEVAINGDFVNQKFPVVVDENLILPAANHGNERRGANIVLIAEDFLEQKILE